MGIDQDLDLKRLRYFLTVAEELHFGRAAERLHMAQPPLSRQIRTLENELGIALFQRSTRKVSLTEAGHVLESAARELLRSADHTRKRMEDFKRGHGGTLRLGFVDSASYEVMPLFLRSYRTRFPAVEYELRTLSSDEQHDALAMGEIDVGIARVQAAGSGYLATPLGEERLVLAVPGAHSLAGRKSTSIGPLRDEVFVGFERGASPTLFAELGELFATAGIRYEPVIEATEYTTVLGLVASGQGVAVVPACVRSFQPPGLRYLRLNDPMARTALFLLRRAEDRRALVGHAVDLAAELFGEAGSASTNRTN